VLTHAWAWIAPAPGATPNTMLVSNDPTHDVTAPPTSDVRASVATIDQVAETGALPRSRRAVTIMELSEKREIDWMNA